MFKPYMAIFLLIALGYPDQKNNFFQKYFPFLAFFVILSQNNKDGVRIPSLSPALTSETDTTVITPIPAGTEKL
jgi:hypothetical protein